MTRRPDDKCPDSRSSDVEEAFRIYETISDAWVTRSEDIDILQLYKPVLDLLPSSPTTVLDIGAGTGRDAAWFAGNGHLVTVVEPTDNLRTAGKNLHADKSIDWVEGHLPHLTELGTGKSFRLQVLIGVWQHLPASCRPTAMKRLFELAGNDGRVVMSLRHGPGAPGRPVFAIDAEATVSQAKTVGFSVLRQVQLPSIQPWNQENGVDWTWLVLERSAR